MKLVDVTIKSISPLLEHRFDEGAEHAGSTRKMLVEHRDPRKEAEKAVYKTAAGVFYFPSTMIARMLREAGTNHKMRGSRKSIAYIVPSAVLLPEEIIVLLNGDGKSKIKDFEVDSRPVTIPATKGRIMRHRPRFDNWSAKFALEIDETILPLEVIHQLLGEGGLKQGIGDFRPQKGGPFGRFQVIEWAERA